ncbi:MAG: polysaccharide deacetylase, partial [Ruminococcaceae bacterium]|nr:polysaccharide deacetylase [Oscillospiraceae bacterium]
EYRWVKRIRNSYNYFTKFTYDEMPEVYAGHEIAGHGLHHYSLTAQTAEDCEKEIVEDLDGLWRIFGKRPAGHAYPFGAYNDAVVDILEKAGVRYARTCQATNSFDLQTADLLRFHPTCHHREARLMEMAKEFAEMKPDEPKLFYVWGHSCEFEEDGNWEIIERFCDYLAGRDDIFYGTNEEILLGGN